MKLRPLFPASSCFSMIGLALHLTMTARVHAPVHGPPPAASNAFGAKISDRYSNVQGKVMILMYHHTGPKEKNMFRSQDNFRSDLEKLYAAHYRPVTVREYVEDKMPLPPGASPVIFTFDDSHQDQFNMLDDKTVDPDSFVGMWMEFAKTHPDFPVHATFYVNNNGPWNQKQFLPQKLAMLKQWGCEIGNHTAHHPNLKKLTSEQVKKEIADCSDMITALGFEPVSFCYPFGNEPHDMSLIEKGFTYNGKTYKFESATLAGAEPAKSRQNPKWDPYRIARVQAAPGVEGVDWWLEKVAANQSAPYVQP